MSLEQVYGAVAYYLAHEQQVDCNIREAENEVEKSVPPLSESRPELHADATPRREPRIDFQTAQAARLDDLDDEAVLRLAASQSRILISHDKRTMPEAFASFVGSDGTSPGVLLVIPQNAPIRKVA